MEETDETGTVEKASGNVQLSISLPSAPLLRQHVAFPSLARCPGGGTARQGGCRALRYCPAVGQDQGAAQC